MTISTELKTELPPLLLKAAGLNRIGSAYVLTGDQVDILKNQALLFAKRLNCLSEILCDTCQSCQKINRKTHPDLHLISSNGEIIKIDLLRDLQKRLHLKPFEGNYKVVIIDGAEHLNLASSNSLLKILEEPPPQTVFLLLTPYAERLIETILSRCQIVRTSSQMKKPLPSIEFSHQLLSLPETHEELFELAKKISKEDPLFHDCLDLWLAWYRTLLFYKEGLEPLDSYFKTKEILVKNVSRTYSIRRIHKNIDTILETKKNLQFQIKRDLLAENLLIQLKRSAPARA